MATAWPRTGAGRSSTRTRSGPARPPGVPNRSEADERGVRLLLLRCVAGGRGWTDDPGPPGSGWTVRFAPLVLARYFGTAHAARVRNGLFLVHGHQEGQEFCVDEVLHRQSVRSPDGGAVLVTELTAAAPGFVCRWSPANGAADEDLEEPAIVRKARRRRREGAGA